MSLFAGPGNPIRCSKLASIYKCSMRVVMLYDEEDTEGGPAAQTGSVVHAGVAEFHRLENDPHSTRKKAAWDAINVAMTKFPLADATEVRLYITPYMEDPRNIDCRMIAVEQEVEFTLEPHPFDETGQKVYVQGTLDQIREVRNGGEIWDLKTGKKTGWELIHDHAVQIAAYTIGAKQWIKGRPYPTPIEPGGIIRAMGYRARTAEGCSPDGVFYSMPYTSNELELILENVLMHVAMIRRGYATFGPGPHCTYCEFGGLAGCTQRYRELYSK